MAGKPIPLDLETESISAHPRPGSPPPGGLAIRLPGANPIYLAWGHASENGAYSLVRGKIKNVTKEFPDLKRAATLMLKDAFRHPSGVLGHNVAKFDLPIIEDHLGLKPPSWDKVDDTLFSLFLRDPHSSSLSLKPAAERWLGEKPEERDAVFDWLAEHGVIAKPQTRKGKLIYQKDAGAYILKAPGSLVAAYAIGDITRAEGLHEMCMPYVEKHKMREAYDRERELAPVLLDNERTGIRVDMDALDRDLPGLRAALAKAEDWIRKTLKAPSLNIDSDDEVAAALKKAKIVTKFPKTPTGKDSVSKKNLTIDFFKDERLYHALHYRNTMATVLTQSLEKWFGEGSIKGGYIYREWNQVRQAHGEDNKAKGARSGRVTVSGLANIAKRFGGKDPDYKHPAFMRVPEPPLARSYVLPDEGDEFGHCDFDQQEMKITAHYEDGALAEKYREDPKTDIHAFVHDLMNEVADVDYNRDVVKQADFMISYGGGANGLSERLRIPYEEARTIINHWKRALPDVVELDGNLKDAFKQGKYIRTLGGRIYYCKPPTIAKKGPRKGQMITFEYTALNYLIQPSAADQTKKALIMYHKHPKRTGRLLCTVYDEINISMKNRKELKILEECMTNAFRLDVPVTVTKKAGASWGKLEKIEAQKEAA